MTKYEFLYSATMLIFNVASFLKPKRVYGLENVPEGAAVICPNHVHFSDPFYIIHTIPRRHKVWVMSKEEVRHWPVVGRLMDWSDFIIFVKRGKADVGAVKAALKALKGGEKLLLFPEGTRHDEVGEGKTGAAMMAIRTGAPLLPVHISPQRKLFQPIEIRFGQAYMPFTEDRKANAEDYQIATDILMEKIKALGQEGKA